MARSEKNDKLNLEGIFSNGYGIIPKAVMRDKDITAEAKAIYSYLCSFAGSGNTAFPSVGLMSDELGLGENRFYKHRKMLVEKGYITIERIQRDNGTWENNVYTLPNKPHLQNEGNPQFRGMDNPRMDFRGMDNEGTNNNSITNNSNNKDIVESSPPSDNSDNTPYKEIIKYLNEKTGSKYRPSTAATQRLIKARFKEGFDLEDFKRVIDVKTEDWLNDKKMAEYLRPQTLFGTKFEGYLNQPRKVNAQKGAYTTDEYEGFF